jgi:hypothetical protein
MENNDTQKKSRVERTDTFWVTVSEWNRERIRKSLIRPLYQEALRSLFLVALLLLDSLLPLQLFESLPSPLNGISAVVVLGLLLYGEAKAYNMVWGKKGRWSIEKYKKTTETTTDKKTDVD